MIRGARLPRRMTRGARGESAAPFASGVLSLKYVY